MNSGPRTHPDEARGTADPYEQLIAFVEGRHVGYRLIDHAPEGRTDLVSVMRGHDPRMAAKCMVIMVKVGKKVTRYVLGVVPGDARVDLSALKSLLGGTYVSFASPQIAETLAGSVVGTVLPFSFSPDLELIVDPGVLLNDEIYFNAARLDRSMVINTTDYVAIAAPRVAPIAERSA